MYFTKTTERHNDNDCLATKIQPIDLNPFQIEEKPKENGFD